jgi:S1-C subfamily serine protease
VSLMLKWISFVIVGILFVPAVFGNGVDNSVVRITCTAQGWRYDEPWQMMTPNRGSGTGFVISGNRIVTNAHVVSDARYIEVQRNGDDKKYIAQVKYIAHDCDLAVLDIQNDIDFFKTMVPLELGELPEIDSVVTTYGFPLGGTHLSVTRGVVSRIQMWNYAHSGSDSHLVIQTDAAINPGNSGGPVLQDGKVVGVAFQGLTEADNIGYLIPCSVLMHLLKDIEDGRVDGFGELGISFRQDLQNPMVRSLLKVPDSESGVLITQVFPRMPAYGKILPLDVLLGIGDYRINDDAMVKIDGREFHFSEVMERSQVGDQLKFELWRDGKRCNLELPLTEWNTIVDHRRPYDKAPRFKIVGGLCFTPLSMGYLITRGGLKNAPLSVRDVYYGAMADETIEPGQEELVLSVLLPDVCNEGGEDYVGLLLLSINDQQVLNLEGMIKIIEDNKDPFLRFVFSGSDIPLILDHAQVNARELALLARYRVALKERL